MLPISSVASFQYQFPIGICRGCCGNKQLATLVMATLSHGQHLQRFQRVRIEKKIQKTDICDAGIVVSPSLEGVVCYHNFFE